MADAPPLLALFYARLGDSRLAEFEAVSRRLGATAVDGAWDRRPLALNGGDTGPRLVQKLPRCAAEDHALLADTAAMSVGCRGVFEVWGQGDSIEACADRAAAVSAEHIRARIQGPWRVESVVLGARRSQHPGSLGARMAAFGSVLDAIEDRPVDLDNPAHRLWLVEDQQRLKGGQPIPEPPPRYMLLLKLVGDLPSVQPLLSRLDLRRRAFLSTSTLPADRALMLCNLALAGAQGHRPTLLDPYCGSGGILLAGAALGAETVGSDLDWRLVSDNRVPICIPATPDRPDRGVEPVRMRDNFDEAQLPQPKALLTLDVGAPKAAERLLKANGGKAYHALVCDPPYGRREFQHGEQAWDGALTFKVNQQALAGTLRTLLRLARETLRPGGRLVFLAPVRAPRDPAKPSLETLRTMLQHEGDPHGMKLLHLGVEQMHRGLHRATVVMARYGRSDPLSR